MFTQHLRTIALTTLAFLFVAAFTISCTKKKGLTDFGVVTTEQTNSTNLALNLNGRLIKGSMPTQSTGSGGSITIQSAFQILEVGAGSELFFPITTNRDSSICKVYFQVQGADAYWEAPIARDSFGQISLHILIPKILDNSSFPIVFAVVDCNGSVSATATTTISVTDNPIYVQGASGNPRFNLQFSSKEVDFDLHVITPLGGHIYYSTDSADGGTLDVDCICCDFPDENIYWEPGTAPSGKYEYYVDFYSSCGDPSAAYILRVYNNANVVQYHTGTLNSVGQDSPHFIFNVP